MTNSITIVPPTTSFRQSWYNYAPQWWRAYWGSRVGWSMMTEWDALAVAGGYAVLAGLPSRAPSDALPWIGQDRQIFPGPNEPEAGYRARLQQWLDLWAHAGSSTALLLAVRGYVAPLLPEVVCVMSSGDSRLSAWDTYADGVDPFPPGASIPTPPDHYLYSGLANWDWDGATLPFYFPFMRWRKWIIIFSQPGDDNSPWEAPSAVWASGGSLDVGIVHSFVWGQILENESPASPGTNTITWGDGVSCWGWAGTANDATSLAQLAKTWKSAGCWVPWIIVSYDSTKFQQTEPVGVTNPDGTWGYAGSLQTDSTYGRKWATSRPSCTTCTLIAGTTDGGGVLGVG